MTATRRRRPGAPALTLVLAAAAGLCAPPWVAAREAGPSLRIRAGAQLYSADALDQLHRQVVASFPPGAPLALRCLLDERDYRGGRGRSEMREREFCDYLTRQLEDRGLSGVFPSTSPRLKGEEDVLMIIEALPRPR